MKRAWGCKYVKNVKETFPSYHNANGKLVSVEQCTHLYSCQIENCVLRIKVLDRIHTRKCTKEYTFLLNVFVRVIGICYPLRFKRT